MATKQTKAVPNKQYETRSITHGNEWGAFAGFDVKDGAITFDKPTVITGLTETSFDETQDSSPIFADNQVHITAHGNIKTEGSIKLLQFNKKFVENHLGVKALDNGMTKNTMSKKPFVFMFQDTVTDEFGDNKRKLTIYYNVTTGAVKAGTKTDEDKITQKEFEVPVTANPNNFVLDKDGENTTYVQIMEDETNSAFFDNAYEMVILPTTTEADFPVPTP